MQIWDLDIFRRLTAESSCTPCAPCDCCDCTGSIAAKKTSDWRNDPFYRTLNGQIVATALLIAAGVLNLYVLFGQKEEKEYPKYYKDYSYLKSLPRATIIVFLVVSAYFLYVSYMEIGYKKTGPFYWTLFANLLLFSSAVIKTGVVFTAPSTEAEAEAAATE